MFGYITINEPELRVRELSLYRSYYCGICEDLHQSYGRFGQLMLNYDTTFLGFLLTCLYEPADETAGESACLAHPFRKHAFRRSIYTQYAADMTVLLAWYAGEDDWKDEKKLRGLALTGVLYGAFQKASSRHPEKAAVIRECLDRLHDLEKEHIKEIAPSSGTEDPDRDKGQPSGPQPAPVSLPDAAAACFGELMAEIFVFQKDAWEEPLRAMGFYLGKFIYLMDAYEDLDRDASSGSFNPLLPVRNRIREQGNSFDEYMKTLLTMLMASCCRAFEMLPIVENIDILRNILYAGVWNRLPANE